VVIQGCEVGRGNERRTVVGENAGWGKRTSNNWKSAVGYTSAGTNRERGKGPLVSINVWEDAVKRAEAMGSP